MCLRLLTNHCSDTWLEMINISCQPIPTQTDKHEWSMATVKNNPMHNFDQANVITWLEPRVGLFACSALHDPLAIWHFPKGLQQLDLPHHYPDTCRRIICCSESDSASNLLHGILSDQYKSKWCQYNVLWVCMLKQFQFLGSPSRDVDSVPHGPWSEPCNEIVCMMWKPLDHKVKHVDQTLGHHFKQLEL